MHTMERLISILYDCDDWVYLLALYPVNISSIFAKWPSNGEYNAGRDGKFDILRIYEKTV